MIVLGSTVREAIVDHAREGAPAEVCGVLAGSHDREESRAERAHRTPNVAPSPRVTYEIDPEVLFETIDEIESSGREVVGFYHSHPDGPPRPSPTDEARATWEGYSYVIVEPGADPRVGSWRWTGETFEEEPIETE
ncbi:MAG TPA: desampylase [Natrialbaceae archaeon]|nr:desampylase [Natrialbaceae archaeon]